jgi:hypothetical protein
MYHPFGEKTSISSRPNRFWGIAPRGMVVRNLSGNSKLIASTLSISYR